MPPLMRDPADRWVRLVRYYHACVAHESGFSELIQRAAGGGRYVFLPTGSEPLLSDCDGTIEVDSGIRSLAARASDLGESLFYGYPVLLFNEAGEGGVRRKLAPLFVFEQSAVDRSRSLYMREPTSRFYTERCCPDSDIEMSNRRR